MYTTWTAAEGGAGRWVAGRALLLQALPNVVTRHDGAASSTPGRPAADAAHPIDIVVANRTGLPEPHPAKLPRDRRGRSLVQFPAPPVVMDVLLHKNIAAAAPQPPEPPLDPTAGHVTAPGPRAFGRAALLTYPTIAKAPAPWKVNANWSRRLRPRRLPADEFILYRCLGEWPLWALAVTTCSSNFSPTPARS